MLKRVYCVEIFIQTWGYNAAFACSLGVRFRLLLQSLLLLRHLISQRVRCSQERMARAAAVGRLGHERKTPTPFGAPHAT